MPETLILRFSADDEKVDWVVNSDAGETSLAGRGPLADVVPVAAGKRVVAFGSASKILRLSATLPIKGTAKIRQALPFALEEQIAGNIELQHFAFSKADASGAIPVAVAAHELMEKWTSMLADAGIRVEGFYSESDGIPVTPATISILIDGDDTIIRDQGGEFTVTDTESMPFMLEMILDQHAAAMENDAAVVPVNLLCYCDDNAHADFAELWDRLRMRAETVESKILVNGALAFISDNLQQNGGVNLLQGDYAPKTEINIDWGPWRVPVALVAGLVTLVLLFQGASWWQLAREEAALDAAAETVLNTTFPDAAGASNPWNALESRLGATESAGPELSGPGFTAAISVLTAAFKASKNLEMQTLGFRSGVLDLQLSAPDVDTLDTLRQKIGEAGVFEATIQSANPDDKGIKGRMQITAVGQ